MSDELFIADRLTAEEIELYNRVRDAEQFVLYAWDLYGRDWAEHIPREKNGMPTINLLTKYLFRYSMQNYQAVLHYAPQRDRIVMGGAGCGKTEAAAISHACKCILRRGHDLLWVAPSLEQATLAYTAILSWGEQGHFSRIFLKHSKVAPAPEIQLYRWDKNDPGTVMKFRSTGANPVELLRGGTFAFAVADEAMRTYNTDWYIGPLAGRLRGPNRAKLNAEPDLADEYARRIQEIEVCEDGHKRDLLHERLEQWTIENDLAKLTHLTVIGNAPRTGRVWWQRLKWGYANPQRRYSAQWSARDNLYLGKNQIALQEQQFMSDPEEIKLEIDAQEIGGAGEIFPYLDTFFDPELTAVANAKVTDGEKDWVLETHHLHGLYHYEKPPVPQGAYAFGLDPGTGIFPGRNKWVLIGARIDKGPPFEVVYINMGNMRGQHGTPDPWIHAVQDVKARYPMAERQIAIEASGTQKDTHYIIWQDDLFVIPMNMTRQVANMRVALQRTIRADMWMCPDCPVLEEELSDYKLVMQKHEPQDAVVALMVLNQLIYNLPDVRNILGLNVEEYNDGQDMEQVVVGREARLPSHQREVRLGR